MAETHDSEGLLLKAPLDVATFLAASSQDRIEANQDLLFVTYLCMVKALPPNHHSCLARI